MPAAAGFFIGSGQVDCAQDRQKKCQADIAVDIKK
jgi:hypothetical protein